MRNLTNDETEYTFGRNLSNDNGEILSFDLSANLPLVYTSNTDEASVIGLKGLNALGTANQVLAMDGSGTNMIFKNDSNTEYSATDPIDICGTIISLKGLNGFTANKIIKVNSAGDALEYADDNDTNYWNLNSFSLTPKLNTYNVIIGDEDNANANNVELLVYGDMELKNTLFSTNNNENKIDFDTTYGIDFYGYYYSPSLRSYNMSFRNNTHGSYFPYLGVSNTGDFLFHINGRGDTMIMKADATRDVLITAGDLIGETSSLYSKNRMKDIFCRNIYSEAIEIKNSSSSSSANILLYEASDNGSGFVKLQAPASLASDITATLPSTTGTLALQSEIRTDAQIRGLFSGTSPISVSALGVISTSFTPTSTETMENKTLKSPIFTSTSGAYEKMILKDENLTHNINIFTPNLTGNINIGFPSVTGTLAITDDIPNTTDIRGLFSSAGNPITYSNGVIGWTNSNNYIALTNLSASNPIVFDNTSGAFTWTNSNNYVDSAGVLTQIGSAENISTASILGNPNRTFGNSASATIINGTSTTINNLIGTGTSGDNARLTLKDQNLDHNAIIKCVNFSEDRTFYLNDGGTFLTSGASSTSSIRGLFSGTSPISVSALGVISTSFTPTSTTNLSNKTFIDPLIVSPTNTTSFYIAQWLASSIGDANSVEFVIGKNQNANNTGSIMYYHSSDGSTSNKLKIGMKTKEDILELKADTNIIMNSNQLDIITPNGTDDCNLILSAGHNGGAGNSSVLTLQNTNSSGTLKKAQLFLNGADDYLVLKNLVTAGRIELVVGTTKLGIFNTSQSEILNTTIIGSNRFKVKHVGGYNYISNPEGTQFDDDTKAGSHISYHDNATEMTFNCPNSTYRYTNSSNHRFMFNGGTRFSIFGSSNPCIQMTKTTGANYNKQGVGTTFPTEIGSWSSQTIPFLESFYIGGQSTNDSEGYFLTMNGQTTGISTPGDNEAFWWLDEDSAPGVVGWKISIAGAISAVSDSRTKSNVKTYKNSNFDKYKKIRTITYNRKIPKELNPKRLEKQSCIDKYNEIHYGVIAEELYDLYPEIENSQDIRKRDEWNYRKDNWNKGIYEKELEEWKEKKNNYDKEKSKDDKEEFKVKPPNKDFDEEMPYKVVDYERINIISVGVIQDLIKQNEIQQKQIDQQQTIIDKLLSSNSFKEFKS